MVCDPSGQVIRANRAAERLSRVNAVLQPFDVAFPLCRASAATMGAMHNCRCFPWHRQCNSSVELKRRWFDRTDAGSSCY